MLADLLAVLRFEHAGSWRCLMVFLGLLSLLSSAPVAAQGVETPAQSVDIRARVAFEAGREAYAHGRFGEALMQFDQAYAINAHPMLLFNIARAAEFDGQHERAIQAYRQYLAALPEASNSEFVEARIKKLKADWGSSAVPSPAATARLSPEGLTMPYAQPARDDADERPLYKRGWFWGVVGGAVAAGTATALVVGLRKSDPARSSADDYVVVGARTSGAQP